MKCRTITTIGTPINLGLRVRVGLNVPSCSAWPGSQSWFISESLAGLTCTAKWGPGSSSNDQSSESSASKSKFVLRFPLEVYRSCVLSIQSENTIIMQLKSSRLRSASPAHGLKQCRATILSSSPHTIKLNW